MTESKTRAYILADKPSGVPTQGVSSEKPGYCEWLEKKTARQLYITHRLDKETSGCMIFGTTPEVAAHLTDLFNQRKIREKYLFITDRKPALQEWVVESEIQKDGKAITSGITNSRTEFRQIKNRGKYFLIEAQTCTGKAHQIRLHARDSGVALLGDTTYGGSAFPHFLLHSQSLTSEDGTIAHSAPWPLVFDHLEWLDRPLLCQWLISYDRRARLYPELLAAEQCLRLVHNEGTPLRADKLGNTVNAGWWDDRPPRDEVLTDLHYFFEVIGIQSWSLQHYRKQKTQGSGIIVSTAPLHWNGFENGACFEFKHEVGHAPGLFLDQRQQRSWVRENSQGLKVLNLFSYTGGFSLMAALGGAETVVTVDLSKKYIEWSKENFRLNALTPENYKFYDMDSQEYLKYAEKKRHLYDIIICDPPSFSRNGNQTFQIDRDFKVLLQKMAPVLSSSGVILFSTNFEQWDGLTWERALENHCRDEKLEFTRLFSWQWDFEIDPTSALVKAFQIKKESIA